MASVRLLAVGAALLVAAGAGARGDDRALFTVRDSIEFATVPNITGYPYSAASPGIALLSPDASKLLFRLRRGDLERNRLIDELRMFEVAEVNEYLCDDGGRGPPESRLVT